MTKLTSDQLFVLFILQAIRKVSKLENECHKYGTHSSYDYKFFLCDQKNIDKQVATNTTNMYETEQHNLQKKYCPVTQLFIIRECYKA